MFNNDSIIRGGILNRVHNNPPQINRCHFSFACWRRAFLQLVLLLFIFFIIESTSFLCPLRKHRLSYKINRGWKIILYVSSLKRPSVLFSLLHFRVVSWILQIAYVWFNINDNHEILIIFNWSLCILRKLGRFAFRVAIKEG